VIYRLDREEKRRQEEEKCVCVTAYRRDTKRLRKDLRLLLETKSVGAATECCLLAIDGRRTARGVHIPVWVCGREKCCRLRFCHANRYSNWWLLQIDASEFRQAWINERVGEISRTLFVWVLRRPRRVCSMHAYIRAHTASARTYRIKRGAGGAVHRRSCHFPHLINARPNNQSCALRNVNCGHTRVVLKCNTCAPVRSPANVN
jgi:hypothetical protein